MYMTARERFEMWTMADRINEMCDEYRYETRYRTIEKPTVKTNMRIGYISIEFETFGFLVFVFEHQYIFSWLRLSGDRSICDGFVICPDMASTVREVNDRMFSRFSPVRGLRWYQYNQPQHFKKRKKGV